MRKTLSYLVIALILLIPGIVNAEEFNFTMPDAVYQSSGNGVTSYAPVSGQWWGKNIYSLGSWITPFSNGDLSYNTNGIAVVYNTTSLCANSSGILTGSFYTNGSTSFFDGYSAFSVYLNSRQCSVYYNGYYLSFSCSVYNETSLNLSLNGANVQREAEVGLGLGQVGTLTCDVGNNDIIINNNNNTQNIINNQNQNQQQTNDKLDELNQSMTSEDSDVTSSKCGMICKLKGIFTGIIELPGKIANLIMDGLKSLFVPTDNQLYEIINDSKALAENFGFVGESMNFFINIFTSLLGMVNANGCLELPEFTLGATTLFESHTFWESQQVCLANNPVLSKNIDTIRTITSVVLVGLFISFASGQFFKILSKNESQNDAAQSVLDRYK